MSFCPELAVSSCGDTVGEARQQLKTALRLFIEEAEKMGTLEDILKEDGYSAKDASGNAWTPPPLIVTEHSEIAF